MAREAKHSFEAIKDTVLGFWPKLLKRLSGTSAKQVMCFS